MLSLSILDGRGRDYPLDEGTELTVGTASHCSIRLAALDVSRSHALVTCRRGKVIVLDLGSTNGTFVNGRRVKESELIAGDQLRFSSVGAQLVAASSPERPEAGTAVEREEESTSGGRPALLEDSLLELLTRWSDGGQPAQLVLVDWLVRHRAVMGAAVLDVIDGEVGVLAAEGQLKEILDDPRCADMVRGGGMAAFAPEGVHLVLAGRNTLALRAHDTPWLLVDPGRSMPEGAELALFVRLLAVARKLDFAPAAPQRG
jgi:FHA domain